ncbi:FtsX-like permease family protein [uncultured Oscillibacter sp.]|uniref:FtsX-like permease family protein n=1 Tax=uncultured Oscillibacter sp. TaxID=876091 RepID=UPI002670A8BB|nr:ABC transporter permease [uncultured Oscillibacter sp.]
MSVTLSELSLRNAKRQARDYLVYFVTVVMAAALLYSFNGLVFSQEIITLSKGISVLPLMIVLASVVVVCVFGWLVAYATRFMLLRRGRELGLYLLIGLENRQLARLFFLENLAVGGCALVLGTALGGLLYQAFRAIVLALFGQPYAFSFGFSLPALGLTVLYFALIYLFALRRSRKYIRRANIHDLIYVDRANEGMVIQTGTVRRWMFSFSIVLGVAGTCLLMAGGAILGVIGAGCVIAFLFGFFLSFASGVPAFFDRRPARKYRGQSLLVFRTLTAKLATMGVLMATISMIFTATLISEGAGLVFRGLFAGRAAENACFDLYIGAAGDGPVSQDYFDYIQDNISAEQELHYCVYQAEDSRVMDYVESMGEDYHRYFDRDPVLRYSDYAALRAIAGYPPVELKPGEYLIHCRAYLEKHLTGYTQPISLGGASLIPGGVHAEHLLQNYDTGNGARYILVVPDEAAEGLPVFHHAYAAKTAQPVTESQFDLLCDINYRLGEQNLLEPSYDEIHTKASEKAEEAVQTVLFVFPLFYLALALTMTAATILTIQQLSETERYRQQFQLLQKLGMDRREMAKALGRQFTIYYVLPAVPPVLIGIPFILHLSRAPEPGVMAGMNSPGAIAAISLGIFFLIYAIYILLAYTSLRRNVLPQ